MNLKLIIFLFIFFILIEAILALALIIKIIKYHSLSIKDTFIYPILLLLTSFIVLSGLSIKPEMGIWKRSLTSFKDSVDIIKLSVDQSFIDNLKAIGLRGKLILFNYYGSYIISLFAIISLSISLLKTSTKNFWKIIKKNFKDEITFIFGFSENTKNFIRSLKFEKRKNIIFVFDSSKLDRYLEEKFFLEKYKIAYVFAPYSNEKEIKNSLKKLIFKKWWNITQFIRFVRTKFNLINYNVITFFDDEARNVNFINAAKKIIIEKECYGGFYYEKVVDGKIYIGDYFCIETDIPYPTINNELPVAYNISKKLYLFKANKPSNELIIESSNKKDYFKDNTKSFYEINKSEFIKKRNKKEYISFDTNTNVRILKFKEFRHYVFNICCDSIQQSLLDKIISSNDNSDFNLNYLVNGKLEEKEILDYSFGLVRTYNKYEIISLDFIKKYSFASFIDKENIDSCTLKNCDINLYVLGYGKINQILLRDILICNSFAEKDNDSDDFKLLSKRINVKVYDKNKRIENVALANAFIKYDTRTLNNNKYYPLPNNYINYPEDFKFDTEISDYVFIKNIYNDINEKIQKQKESSDIKKQYNFFIVSLDTDSKNWSLASTMEENLSNLDNKYCKNIFFVRTSNYDYLYGNKEFFKDKNIYGFGVENVETKGKNNITYESALSYDNIIKQKLISDAKQANVNYELKIYDSKIDNSYVTNSYAILNKFKQKSNLYSILGLYSKFSLLFEHITKTKDGYELDSEFFKDNNLDSNHFTTSKKYDLGDILAFIEHERWNAFEIGYGVLPLKVEEAKRINSTQIKSLYHLCITTAAGVNDLNNDGFGNYINYDYDIINYFVKNKNSFNIYINELLEVKNKHV